MRIAVLLVLDFPEVPLDNNEAERALREYVVKRKISNGTRTEAPNSSLGNFSRLGRYLSQAGSELLPVHPRSHIPNLRDASTGYLDCAEVSTLSQLNSILSKFKFSSLVNASRGPESVCHQLRVRVTLRLRNPEAWAIPSKLKSKLFSPKKKVKGYKLSSA